MQQMPGEEDEREKQVLRAPVIMLGEEDEREKQVLHAAVVSVFGGVGAISREAYKAGLQHIATQCGRVIDDAFMLEVLEELNKLPCPMD